MLYFRKEYNRRFVPVALDDGIPRKKLSIQTTYFCYHQLAIIMQVILTQIMKKIMNVEGDVKLQYNDPGEQIRGSALNIMLFCHSIEHQFYDEVPKLITKPPARFQISPEAGSEYAQCGIAFISELQRKHALSYTLLRSMQGKAMGLREIPLITLCAEGFIVYQQPTYSTTFLPFRSAEAQRTILAKMDAVETTRLKADAEAKAEAKAQELLALLDAESADAAAIKEQQEKKKAAKSLKKQRARNRRAEVAAAAAQAALPASPIPPAPIRPVSSIRPAPIPPALRIPSASPIPPPLPPASASPSDITHPAHDDDESDDDIEIILDYSRVNDSRLTKKQLNIDAEPFLPASIRPICI